MRLAFALCLLPGIAFADVITLDSRPTAVQVLTDAAEITRSVTFDMPAGTHDLVVPDLPQWADTEGMQAKLQGAVLRSLTVRSDAPRVQIDTPQITAARAELTAAQDALAGVDDRIDTQQRQIRAAQAQLAFLDALKGSDSLPPDAAQLAAISQMIASETDAAETRIAAAKQATRPLARQRKARAQDVADAAAALEALLTAGTDRQQVTLVATSDVAGPVTLSLTYFSNQVAWGPTYSLRLTTGDAPTLQLDRGAWVRQSTGEDWTDVALTLSTATLARGAAPSELWERRLQIVPPGLRASARTAEADVAPVPVMEAADVSEKAVTQLDGPAARYSFAAPVSIANRADDLRIALDTVSLSPEVYAQAVPSRDQIAYRMVSITNDLSEVLLPATQSEVFVDGQLVGFADMPLIAPGAQAELPFGPLETLRLSVVDRLGTGDTGIINRANERQEVQVLRLENTGLETWPVRLRGAVPFSEQDDLEISWTADPRPDIVDAEDRQGILEWRMIAAPGDVRDIRVQTRIRWPLDMDLR